MKKTAKFGYIWQNIKDKKEIGTSIDVKTVEELQQYKQVLKTLEKTTISTVNYKRKGVLENGK